MKLHISKVSASCFYHVRRLRKIRRQRSGDSSRPGTDDVELRLLQLVVVGCRSVGGPVQAVLSHALNLLWKVPGLSDQHRESRRLRSSSLRSPILVVEGLLIATVTHQVQRARVGIRRPVYVERSTRGLTCCY